MFQIDMKSRTAIYEQIIENFKELIMTGALNPEDKVPSIRDLAKSLTINPNTIQKAYRDLELQGYIYTVSGLGSFVATPPKSTVNAKKIDQLKETVTRSLNELIYLNCPKKELYDIFERLNLTQGEECQNDQC